VYQYIPNVICFFRIGTGLLLWYLIGAHATLLALVVLTIGAWSDFFDGYFARRWNIESSWGAFLDPLADKIMIIAPCIALWLNGIIAWWVVAAIIGRDMFITGVRSTLMARKQPLTTLWLAKVKTVIQLGSLYLFVIGNGALQGDFGDLTMAQNQYLTQGLSMLASVVAGITVLTALIYIPQIVRKLRS
jgi:CDP-diacylglycerol--glycerol-3-phosphate 3-phosphatidyltransferase